MFCHFYLQRPCSGITFLSLKGKAFFVFLTFSSQLPLLQVPWCSFLLSLSLVIPTSRKDGGGTGKLQWRKSSESKLASLI